MSSIITPFVLAALGGGCISLHTNVGANVPLRGPSRTASFGVGFGTFYGFADKVMVDVRTLFQLGPLGDRSNSLFGGGGTVFTRSYGWRPGLYGTFEYARNMPDDHGGLEPDASGVVAGFGASWSTVDWKSATGFGARAYGAIQLGVAYRHQEQIDIGTGDFLGVEMRLSGGADLADLFHEVSGNR